MNRFFQILLLVLLLGTSPAAWNSEEPKEIIPLPKDCYSQLSHPILVTNPLAKALMGALKKNGHESYYFKRKGMDYLDSSYTYNPYSTLNEGILRYQASLLPYEKPRKYDYFFFEKSPAQPKVQLVQCRQNQQSSKRYSRFQTNITIPLGLAKKKGQERGIRILFDVGRHLLRDETYNHTYERYDDSVSLHVITHFSDSKSAYRTKYRLSLSKEDQRFNLESLRYDAFDWKNRRFQSARISISRGQWSEEYSGKVEFSPVCTIADPNTLKRAWQEDGLVYGCIQEDNKNLPPALHVVNYCRIRQEPELIDLRSPSAIFHYCVDNTPVFLAAPSEALIYYTKEVTATSQLIKIMSRVSLFEPGFNFTDIYPKVFQAYLDPYVKIKPPPDID